MSNNESNLTAIITTFVFLILAITFTGVIGDNVKSTSETYVKTNETVTISAIGSATLANNPVLSLTFFGNASNNTNTNGVFGTDINFTKDTGVIRVSRAIWSGAGLGPYNVSYTYANSNYIENSRAKTLLSLTIILWVVGILVVIAVITVVYLKRNGLM